MNRLIGKSLRIIFLGIVPLFLLTGGSHKSVVNSSIEKGTYHFEVIDNITLNFSGVATFENRIDKDVWGNEVNTLLLNFVGSNAKQVETIEFVISSGKVGQKMANTGVYKIKDLNRLINRFSGVYGFADIGGLSELPYFVKTGYVTITESITDKVKGRLEVELNNANGESLKIKGFFNADIKA